jgi:predicted Zn-dependent protease
MNSIKSEVRGQNITDAMDNIDDAAIAGRTMRTVRPAALVCAFLLALGAVDMAQGADRSRTGGQASQTKSSGGFHTAVIQTAYGPRQVAYEILTAAESGLEEDLAIFEGDIVLGKIDKVRKVFEGDIHKSASRSDTDFRWVDGVVPYEIDPNYSMAEQMFIDNALNHWNSVTPYWFRLRNGESDYIRFVRNTNVICNSDAGRQGGGQDINLDLETTVTAQQCGLGGAIHEIGHAVGLWHEQSRADRNNFVVINWGNIQQGKEFNFNTYIQNGEDGQDMFDYDFGSIMHYGSFAFARTNAFGNPVGPTITRLDGTLINAQTNALSQGDIAGAVRFLSKNGPLTFKFVNVNSGKCLDVANWSRNSNAPVNQFECHGGANQRWYSWTVPGTGRALIINDWSGQCLDIPGASLSDGAQLQQFPCHGFANQRFHYGFFNERLANENSGKCLDVPNASSANGVRIQQFTCHSGNNQKWRIEF